MVRDGTEFCLSCSKERGIFGWIARGFTFMDAYNTNIFTCCNHTSPVAKDGASGGPGGGEKTQNFQKFPCTFCKFIPPFSWRHHLFFHTPTIHSQKSPDRKKLKKLTLLTQKINVQCPVCQDCDESAHINNTDDARCRNFNVVNLSHVTNNIKK